MAKTINYDEQNNLNVGDSKMQIIEGENVLNGTYRSISPGQLEAHLPMFNADMSAADKAKAALIIAENKRDE